MRVRCAGAGAGAVYRAVIPFSALRIDFFQIHLEVKHMKSNSISVKYYFSLNKSVLNRACSILRSSHKSKSRRLLALSVVMPARQEEII